MHSWAAMVVLSLLGCAWLGWAALNIIALVLSPWVIGDRAAYTNGLVIVIPERFKRQLSADELAAIYSHEQGHRARAHAFRNLARSCFFINRPAGLAMQQEHEADDYAAARGYGPALASALRKLSTHPFDLARADRLSC